MATGSDVGLDVRLPRGEAGVSRLAGALAEIAGLLCDVEANLLLGPVETTWMVSDLRSAGPDRIATLEPRRPKTSPCGPPRSYPTDISHPQLAIRGLLDGLIDLRRMPTMPTLFTTSTLGRVGRLAAASGGALRVLSIGRSGSRQPPMELCGTIRTNAVLAGRRSEVSGGTITGTLSRLHEMLRRSTIKTWIREPVEGRVVEVHAPAELAARLGDAAGHPVELSGDVSRNGRGETILLAARAVHVIGPSWQVAPAGGARPETVARLR